MTRAGAAPGHAQAKVDILPEIAGSRHSRRAARTALRRNMIVPCVKGASGEGRMRRQGSAGRTGRPSASMISHRDPTRPAEGFAARTCICLCSRSGRDRSSASIRTTIGAEAWATIRAELPAGPSRRFPSSRRMRLVPLCPFAQTFGRAVGRAVVEDQEFEVAEALAEDAEHGLVQMGQRVVHRHDHAERRNRWPRRFSPDEQRPGRPARRTSRRAARRGGPQARAAIRQKAGRRSPGAQPGCAHA